MTDTVHWHIGKEGGDLERPPFRAYFYWLRDDVVVRSEDYGADELSAEIERLRANGEAVPTMYEEALKRLRLLG